MKIAVVGSTMMDIVSYTDKLPAAGETRAVRDFHTAGGGKGANQAVAAARLGADVLFVSCIGDDMFGDQCRMNYEREAIDTRYVMAPKGVSNGVATIIVEEDGQNRILINKGANDALTPAKLKEAEQAIAACGFIILQLEIPIETVYAAIDMGVAHQIPVLLNPAPARADLDIEKVCACEFFVPNETELSILTGKPTTTVEEIKTAAAELLARGLKNVIVTMGARGSLWLTKERTEFVPTAKVRAVDSTGAGDSYIGCFAETWSRTGDILASMRRASRYAADSVTKPGTQDSYATKKAFEGND